jgi:Methyltransferase domain
MKRLIEGLIRKIPLFKGIVQERDQLRQTLALQKQWMPPGHFYSPVPSQDEVRANEARIFRVPREIPGIDLNEAEQMQFFCAFTRYYGDIPFRAEKTDGLRYYFDNLNYSYSDAVCLYSMIRHVRPKRIIEIGSGYSSCVTLDTNELFFDGEIDCTFIEPHPELLLSLIKENDKGKVRIIPAKLQDVKQEEVAVLEANDILFIDSTHVSKVNSDVNYLAFEVLPALKSGVYVHFHDVFYPFEYPKEWIYEGRAWNESYLLRAFLQYNNSFRIVFFNTFLEYFYPERFNAEMPLCMKNPGGSIWLRKV